MGSSFTTRVYSAGRTVVAALGLRRSRMGRKVLATLNVIGALGMRIFLVSKRRPSIVDGHKMYLGDHHNPSIGFAGKLLQGHYEPGSKELLECLLHSGMVVLDVGAHIGYYTLLAARLVGPEGQVYAFEPEPENYALLEKNVVLNGYHNVKLIPKAVADRAGSVKLFISTQGNDRHSVFQNPRSLKHEASREVAAVSLDEFLENVGWPHVDLVKLDIEGAEPLALDGMRRLLDQPGELKLIVEFAPESLQNGGTSPETFLEKLSGLGLTLSTIASDGSLRRLERTNFPELVAQTEDQGVVNLLCEKQAARGRERSGGL
jgi:FkbM family methyltransferase